MGIHGEFADDAELVKLAAPRAQRLLVVFDRARQLAPLLAILAVIPGLYAVAHRELTDADSAWGMLALKVYVYEQAVPGDAPPDAAPHAEWSQLFAAQPPLGTLLDAVALGLLGPRNPLALVITSYLAFAGLVYAVYLCFRTLCDERFGILVAVLAAGHGPLLETTQRAVPLGMGLLLGFLSLWLMLEHLSRSPNAVSWRLPASAGLLGLCLLTAGMMAVPFAVLVFVKVGVDGTVARQTASTARRHPRLLRQLVLWVALAVLVGGWWCVLVYHSQGLAGLVAWATSAVDTQLTVPGMTPAAREAETWYSVYALQFLALPGLILVGIIAAVRESLSGRPRAETLHVWLLLAFAGFVVVWLMLDLVDGRQTFLSEGVRLPCLIAGTGLTAAGIDEICRRRVSPLLVAVIGCVGLACVQWDLHLLGRSTLAMQIVVLLLALFAAAILWTRLPTTRSVKDNWLRAALTGLLIVTVVGNALVGSLYLRPPARPMRQLQHALDDVDVARSFLVSAEAPPQRLTFTLRTLTPTHAVSHLERGAELRDTLLNTMAQLRRAELETDETTKTGDSLGPGTSGDGDSPPPRFLLVFWGPRRVGDLRINDIEITRQLETILLDGNALHVFVAQPAGGML